MSQFPQANGFNPYGQPNPAAPGQQTGYFPQQQSAQFPPQQQGYSQAPAQPFAPPQGGYQQPAQYGGPAGAPPQQYQSPGLPQVAVGYNATCNFEGQVCPTQRLQRGFEYTASTQQKYSNARLRINLKLRKEANYNNNVKVTVSHVVISAFGQQADQLAAQIQPGQVIQCTCEYSTSEFADKQNPNQINTSRNFNLAKQNGNLPAFHIKGQAPLNVHEKSTPKPGQNNQVPQQQFQQTYQQPGFAAAPPAQYQSAPQQGQYAPFPQQPQQPQAPAGQFAPPASQQPAQQGYPPQAPQQGVQQGQYPFAPPVAPNGDIPF